MARIVRSADCGNSPKNAFVESLAIALATRDVPAVLQSVADDIQWEIVGKAPIRGKTSLARALRDDGDAAVATIAIDRVVTHGRAGAVNGTVEHRDARTTGFCDVFEFSNAKGTSVSRITSYRLDIGKPKP